MSSPTSKRQLRPAASLPSTAETYGKLHGLPEDHEATMRGVSMRIRQRHALGPASGRTLQPTASAPVLSFPTSGQQAFQSARDIMAEAQRVINLSEMRERELQPYGSLSPATAATAGGAVDDNGFSRLADASPQLPPSSRASRKAKRALKRDDGSDTEVDEGDATETEMDDDTVTPAASGVAPGASTLPGIEHGFPPVFAAPPKTHPELFAVPALPPAAAGRQVRGLPVRATALGKAVSMPVGGIWGSGMDVDASDEDGFDVSEWAKSEEF